MKIKLGLDSFRCTRLRDLEPGDLFHKKCDKPVAVYMLLEKDAAGRRRQATFENEYWEARQASDGKLDFKRKRTPPIVVNLTHNEAVSYGRLTWDTEVVRLEGELHIEGNMT